MANVVALTGGGIKAAVAGALFLRDNVVVWVHVDYGQPSVARERQAVRNLAEHFSTSRLLTVELPHVMLLPQMLGTGRAVAAAGGTPAGKQREALPPALMKGILPLLAGVGSHVAEFVGASKLVLGLCDAAGGGLVHPEGEHASRREFVQTMQMMLEATGARSVPAVEAPLVELNDVEILRMAQRTEVPLECTWSCEHGRAQPCGRCPGCIARAQAFLAATLVDPLLSVAPVGAG